MLCEISSEKETPMSRYLKAAACSLLCMLALLGCGEAKLPEHIEVNTLSVSRDGKVAAYLVSDFEKEYYDIGELTSMAMEEAAAYNTEHAAGNGTPVVVEKVETLEDGTSRVRISYQYDSADTFNGFNEGDLFFGTVSEAVSAGYPVEAGSLESVTGGAAADGAKVSGKHVLITDEKAFIYCPYKVAYLSKGAVLNADGSVDTTGTDGSCVILMAK